MGSEFDIGSQIAERSLAIDAIKLQPTEPFKWASGYFMPIYNDNRRHLAFPENRSLILDGFSQVITEHGIEFDGIAGTSTAGIPHAAGLAQRLNMPLFIFHEGQPYHIRGRPGDNFAGLPSDAIASTTPWGIAAAVRLANERNQPFMYARSSPKAHGLQQQVEGIPQKGQRVLLVDQHIGTSYDEDAVAALEEKGVTVTFSLTENISQFTKPVSIKDVRMLVIEDLVSTGGSSADEVKQYRDAGASVSHCISIFNYGLPKAEQLFAEAECSLHGLLTYDVLLKKALQRGDIAADQVEMLREWRSDPFNWGAKHGFPQEPKK